MPRFLPLLLGLGMAAQAAGAAEPTQCSRPVTMSYTTPQIMEAYAARPALGLPSLHEALAAESGCTIQLRPYPTARVWKEYFSGELGIVIGAVQSPERDAIGEFRTTTQETWILLTTRPLGSIPERLEQFGSQHGLLVGILHGGFYSADVAAVIDTLRRQGQIDEYHDLGNGIEKLLANRDAALVTNHGTVEYVLSSKRLQNLNMRLIPQPQFAGFASGVYLNRKALTETDRGVLLRALYAPTVAELADKLHKQRLRELAEAADDVPVHHDAASTTH
jgi:hypothetical protein